jgi:hypothetical protein
MLEAVSTGLHPSAVVGPLAGKYGVSERCLWSDWQRMEKWVSLLIAGVWGLRRAVKEFRGLKISRVG